MSHRRQFMLGLSGGIATCMVGHAKVALPPERRAVELTFLKSNPGMREALRHFVELNWFAMDAIAKQRGLIDHFSVVDTGTDEGDWNVLVSVSYPNELGYDGIQTEFEAIRAAHKTVLVNGKKLPELGRVVQSIKTYEDVGATR